MAKSKKTRPKRDPKAHPKRIHPGFGPTKASQRRFAAAFAEKNERRRTCHKRSPSGYRSGRRSRRAYAFEGAFGKLEGRKYNDCAQGTTQARRKRETAKDHESWSYPEVAA